ERRSIGVEATRNRTGAEADDESWIRHRIPREAHGIGHVRREWTREHQPVGVTGRGHPLDSEALKIEVHVREGVELELATVATSRRDLPQAQGAAECLRECMRRLHCRGAFPLADEEARSAPRGHARLGGELDLLLGADEHALFAKHTLAEI